MQESQTVAVPSTVHCDHLILAKDGAKYDLADCKYCKLKKYLIFFHQFLINMELVSGNPVQELFTRLFWKTMLSQAE